MATALKPIPWTWLSKLREQGLRIQKADRKFLGTNWSFIEMQNGKAFWVHKDGTRIPSARNQGKGE